MTLRQQRPAATPGTQRFPRPAFASRTRSLPRSADPVVPNRAPGITDETCDIPRLSGRLLRALYRRSGDGGAPGSQIERFLAPSGLALLMWSIRKPNSPPSPARGRKGVGGSLRGRCFGKPLRAISRFSHQNAQTPPSPLMGDGGRGDEGKRASGCAGMLLTCRCDHHSETGAPDPSPALRAADRLPQA